MFGQYTSKYLIKKCSVAYRKPAGIHERTSDNIVLAKQFEKSWLDDITVDERLLYSEYADVRMEQVQCNVPGYNDNAQAIRQLWCELEHATKQYNNPYLTDDLWTCAGAACSRIRDGENHVVSIESYIREATEGRTLAIVDRDPARRASMVDKGYVWRMWKNFSDSPKVFRERPDLCRAEVVEYRQGMAWQFLSRRIWKGEWPVDSTPYAYVTYKSKCFSCEVHPGPPQGESDAPTQIFLSVEPVSST